MGDSKTNCHRILEEYIKNCEQKQKNKENNAELNNSNIDSGKNNIEDLYKIIMNEVSKGDIVTLTEFTSSLVKLNTSQPKLKRYILDILFSEESLKGFRNARNNIVDLFPLLVNINEHFNVDYYYELTLKPYAYLYGVFVEGSEGVLIDREPLSNEEIQSMLTLFIDLKENDYLADWTMNILSYMPESIVDKYRKDFSPLREELQKWAWKQVFSNEKYRKPVSDRLFKKKELRGFVDCQVKIRRMENRHKKNVEDNKILRSQIRELEDKYVKELSDYQNKIQAQNEIIIAQNDKINSFTEKMRDYERNMGLLNEYSQRYRAQVGINERIVLENDIRVNEVETENRELRKKYDSIRNNFEGIQLKFKELESDYNLKNNELERIKIAEGEQEKTVRHSLLCELVSGLNNQLYYLTCFYLDLKETGHLEPEGVGLLADTLNAIDEALSQLGVEKIGIIDQKVRYNASLHSSSDAVISNGEEVTISGYGWKIGDEVYIKAPVEKGNA